MNYIRLLNAAFEKFYDDDRLNPSHISLYMALFQEWNSSRFANEFYVSRLHIMRAAKIGSKSTYHRCITNLDSWNYLFYFPSNNPYKGSKLKMAILSPTDETVTGQYNPILEQLAEQYHPTNVPHIVPHHPNIEQVLCGSHPKNGQALVSNTNITKQENLTKQPKGSQALILFFQERGFDADEAKKFYEHYSQREWKTGDGESIRDWRSLAVNWMDRTELFEKENRSNKKQGSQITDNLRTTKKKDYGQPL
ncbi:hypothetical protein ACFO5T_05960 [Dokdonia genika]|uniref:Transcriptional regulator n=1 Tax=Dokdonia genika TaxID=308113 RepID=A0ABV9L8E9_9FLAO